MFSIVRREVNNLQLGTPVVRIMFSIVRREVNNLELGTPVVRIMFSIVRREVNNLELGTPVVCIMFSMVRKYINEKCPRLQEGNNKSLVLVSLNDTEYCNMYIDQQPNLLFILFISSWDLHFTAWLFQLLYAFYCMVLAAFICMY